MNEEKIFLRFDGMLSEDMAFIPFRSWETSRIMHRLPEGDGSFILQLWDDKDKVLTQVKPLVIFHDACFQSFWTMRVAKVIAYIPYHPAARRIVFQREDYVIYETPIAKDSPRLRINRVTSDGNSISMNWTTKHAEGFNLSFNIAYISSDNESVVTLARDLHEHEANFPLDHIPGGEGRLGLLATDGIRSSFVYSDPFIITPKLPELWIISPREGASYLPDQPLSLIGQAVDILGRKLPESSLVWEVDGYTIAKGVGIATAAGMEPGIHTVNLSYREESGETVLSKVTFSVADYNEAQLRYRRIIF